MEPHGKNKISLDGDFNIDGNSWIVIVKPASEIITKANTVIHRSIAAYGLSGKTTPITLTDPWLTEGESFDSVRGTIVYAQPEELELAEEPIESPICHSEDTEDKDDGVIELDGFYEGLESGRWVIVSGEREIDGTSGVRFSELAMLSSVTHGLADIKGESEPRSGEKIHTFIKLANKLAYCFKRDTVTINGNVVKATHGETRHEVLGSGNGATSFQSFELKQFPLTHVSASNPTGVDSTLNVFVNDIEWHETDSLVSLQANDRQFISKTDNEDKTSVIFGNGKKGARLPTGMENIKTVYRNGIGKQGNVKAEQISLLMTKPLGVKEVINPLRASGGANRETGDQARKHVPLAVKALDRLVSVQDYEDFSRIYAGVGKAHSVELSNGRQQIVHVTIAGAEDIPIDQNSDLFKNLRRTLHDFGDPHQAIQLAIRELKFIVLQAGVAILPDYQWEPVITQLREHLLDAFSFERRELGQSIALSEVISVMQSVRGISYVDVDAFGGIPEKITDESGNRRLLTPEEISDEVRNIALRSDQNIKLVSQYLDVNFAAFENKKVRPAQIAFLTPDVPATLILNQIERLP